MLNQGGTHSVVLFGSISEVELDLQTKHTAWLSFDFFRDLQTKKTLRYHVLKQGRWDDSMSFGPTTDVATCGQDHTAKLSLDFFPLSTDEEDTETFVGYKQGKHVQLGFVRLNE